MREREEICRRIMELIDNMITFELYARLDIVSADRN